MSLHAAASSPRGARAAGRISPPPQPLVNTFAVAMPFNVNIEARESVKHGRGLFATAFIAKGTPIWRFAESADCPKSQTGEKDNHVYTRAELEKLAAEDPEKIKDVLWGGYLHDPSVRLRAGFAGSRC